MKPGTLNYIYKVARWCTLYEDGRHERCSGRRKINSSTNNKHGSDHTVQRKSVPPAVGFSHSCQYGLFVHTRARLDLVKQKWRLRTTLRKKNEENAVWATKRIAVYYGANHPTRCPSKPVRPQRPHANFRHLLQSLRFIRKHGSNRRLATLRSF